MAADVRAKNSCGIKLDLRGDIARQRPREVILSGERSIPKVCVSTLDLLNMGRCPGVIVVSESLLEPRSRLSSLL